MSWMEFRGVRSDALGLVVTRMPSHRRAAKRVQRYEIDDRHGELHVSNGELRAIKLSAALSMLGEDKTNLVDQWLIGQGNLILSSDPARCYRAAVYDAIEYERIRLPNGETYDVFQATFDCEPFRYFSEPSSKAISGADTLTNLGTFEAQPILTVKGTGSGEIVINGESILLTGMDGTLRIDGEAKLISAEKGGASMTGAFPVLPIGVSNIAVSGGITSLVVTPNWRFL